MRTQSVITAVMATAISQVVAQDDERVTGELGDAPIVEGNPAGVVYEAVLPEEAWSEISVEGNVKGSIRASSAPDGVGVEYKVQFSNLPTDGGDFSYHIHVAPVPEDGNCTQTLAHLDPYIRTGEPKCNPEAPETCEVGDLSGKHGLIPAGESSFQASYIDPYSSLIDGEGAFFGNRSFVLHFAEDLTRISCANFELKAGGGDDGADDGYYPPAPEETDCTTVVVPSVVPVPPEQTADEPGLPEYSGPVEVPEEPEHGDDHEGDEDVGEPDHSGPVEIPEGPDATAPVEEIPEPSEGPVEAGAGMVSASLSLLGAAALGAVFFL